MFIQSSSATKSLICTISQSRPVSPSHKLRTMCLAENLTEMRKYLKILSGKKWIWWSIYTNKGHTLLRPRRYCALANNRLNWVRSASMSVVSDIVEMLDSMTTMNVTGPRTRRGKRKTKCCGSSFARGRVNKRLVCTIAGTGPKAADDIVWCRKWRHRFPLAVLLCSTVHDCLKCCLSLSFSSFCYTCTYAAFSVCCCLIASCVRLVEHRAHFVRFDASGWSKVNG